MKYNLILKKKFDFKNCENSVVVYVEIWFYIFFISWC